MAETIDRIRELVKSTFVTYGFVTDESGVLLGVVTMRDLLLADRGDRLDGVMPRQPFSLRPERPLLEAARPAVARHFPVYLVCDAGGRLVGVVRPAASASATRGCSSTSGPTPSPRRASS